jgi:TonB family protein
MEASALGRALAHFIQTNLVATESLAGKSEPLVIPPRILQELAATQSVVQIEGDLAGRSLLSLPPLPIQQHNDILTNSIVQAGVNPSGYPESARLLSGSGSKKADQAALAMAKAARFAPLPGLLAPGAVDRADLTWGKLIFQWFTVEWAQTNKPNVKP